MKEANLYSKVMKELNNPVAIHALDIGGNTARWVKPRDGWGRNPDGIMVRIPNPVDMLWTTDCLEVKAVKAKTRRGWTFKGKKEITGKQLEEMRKYNALLAVGFIRAGGTDRLISIPILRLWMLEQAGPYWECVTMQELEQLAPFVIKGELHGKV
jgi:hypothetical protein